MREKGHKLLDSEWMPLLTSTFPSNAGIQIRRVYPNASAMIPLTADLTFNHGICIANAAPKVHCSTSRQG